MNFLYPFLLIGLDYDEIDGGEFVIFECIKLQAPLYCMNQFLKQIVDFIYGTQSKRKKFEKQNNETVIAADASKGIVKKDNTDIKRGADWLMSQRAVILLTEKQIVCGKWRIPLDQITHATLVKIKTLLGAGQVLKIDTKDGEHYQFGMQLNDEWEKQNVLDISVEQGKVKYSAFSWIVRIVALIYLIYWILEEFGALDKV